VFLNIGDNGKVLMNVGDVTPEITVVYSELDEALCTQNWYFNTYLLT
jgi:hypothetical protein